MRWVLRNLHDLKQSRNVGDFENPTATPAQGQRCWHNQLRLKSSCMRSCSHPIPQIQKIAPSPNIKTEAQTSRFNKSPDLLQAVDGLTGNLAEDLVRVIKMPAIPLGCDGVGSYLESGPVLGYSLYQRDKYM